MRAAQELILWHPFDELTIDEIVKAAEMSRPAFYYHFAGGKEELRTVLISRGVLSADASTPDTRQVILEAALRVFARAGVSAATLEDIAAEAGVSRGALSWHFHSKDDLVAGIVMHKASQSPIRQTIDAVEKDIRNGVAMTDEMIFRRIAGGFYDSFCVQSDLTRLPILLLYTHPKAAHILADKVGLGRKPIIEYVKRRQEEGTFCKNIDADFFVHSLGISFAMRAIGRGLNDLMPFGTLSREEIIEQVVSLLLYGMVKREPEKRENGEILNK